MRIWHPARSLTNSTRAYRCHMARQGLYGMVRRRLTRIGHVFWSIVTASDIRLGARLGQRLTLLHPTGIVIHELAEVGDDCIIMQQVTLGQLHGTGAPKIGNNVFIGAGARLLGDIIVGDRARVGANAVVLRDVPQGATVVGIPARIIERGTDREPLQNPSPTD